MSGVIERLIQLEVKLSTILPSRPLLECIVSDMYSFLFTFETCQFSIVSSSLLCKNDSAKAENLVIDPSR